MLEEDHFDADRKTSLKKGGAGAESHLVINLKRQLKLAKTGEAKRKKELEKAKKMIRYTKIKELEVQLNSFVNETIRLK